MEHEKEKQKLTERGQAALHSSPLPVGTDQPGDITCTMKTTICREARRFSADCASATPEQTWRKTPQQAPWVGRGETLNKPRGRGS